MPSSVVSSDPNTENRSASRPPGPVTWASSPGSWGSAARTLSTVRRIGDLPSDIGWLTLFESSGTPMSTALPSADGIGTIGPGTT